MHAPLLDPGGVLDACLSASRAAAFRPLETVGFPLDPTWRDILVSTTILIAGLHHAACILATPGSVQPLAGMHAGSLLTCWRGFRQVGREPFPVLTHWATTTNFMGLRPIPRLRAYLGATSAWLGWFDPWAVHVSLSWTVLTRCTTQHLECLQLGEEPQVLRTPCGLLGDNEPGERQDPDTMLVQLDFLGVCFDGFIGA